MVATFLKTTPHEIVEICRVRLNEQSMRITDAFNHPLEEARVSHQEAPDTYVLFYKRGQCDGFSASSHQFPEGSYQPHTRCGTESSE